MAKRITSIHRAHEKLLRERHRAYVMAQFQGWDFYRFDDGDPRVWYFMSPDKHYFWSVKDRDTGDTFYFQVKEFVVNFCINGVALGKRLTPPDRVHPHVDGP